GHAGDVALIRVGRTTFSSQSVVVLRRVATGFDVGSGIPDSVSPDKVTSQHQVVAHSFVRRDLQAVIVRVNDGLDDLYLVQQAVVVGVARVDVGRGCCRRPDRVVDIDL